MQGKLNSFQKTMLQWNDLHPYNAVHVAQVAQPLELERLKDIIRRTLEGRGLSGLSLDRKRAAFRFHGGPAQCEIQVLDRGQEPTDSLCAEIERQLNTPFAGTGRFEPFRFFVVPAQGTFALGLVYFHAVADAESVVGLLKELVETYQGRTGPPPPDRPAQPASHGAPERRNWLGRLARAVGALPTLWRVMRTSRRPPCQDRRDLRNAVRLFALATPELSGLLQTAKAWGVTVNDLLLGLMLQALARLAGGPACEPCPLTPSLCPTGRAGARRAAEGESAGFEARRRDPRILETPQARNSAPGLGALAPQTRARRRRLSVGCIVNIRRDLGVENPQTFGLFLGSFVVWHEVPEGISLRDLAQAVRAQTARIKQARLYLATPLQLALVRLVWCFFSTERRLGFYQKHHPLWGGLTNMNLNTLWPPQAQAGLADYLRAVSTGPATPLVLSVTTVGDRANVGLSYRPAVFPAWQIEQFQKSFLETIQRLQPCP